jgi:hypothetical protein
VDYLDNRDTELDATGKTRMTSRLLMDSNPIPGYTGLLRPYSDPVQLADKGAPLR